MPLKLVVVGLGQLGGALALRARERWPDAVLVGCDVPEALAAANAAGLLDEAYPSTAWAQAIGGADWIVVAAPIPATLALLPALLATAPPGAIVSDVASVKGPIHAISAGAGRFVGLHPMFGSERSGFASANPSWFDGGLVVLTRTAATEVDAQTRVQSWLEALGARVIHRDPDAHDRELAAVSHAPQLVAYALANLAAAAGQAPELAGAGFRDMTRLAASPAKMWSEICAHNVTHVAAALRACAAELERWASALGRGAALEGELARAQASKATFPTPARATLADRVVASSTGGMLERVMARERSGQQIFGFHIGEPRVPPSAALAATLTDAFRAPPLRYTPISGTAELCARVAAEASAVTGVAYQAANVIVTSGAKQALHLALASLISAGDEVIVPRPAWVSFGELVKLAGGRPVLVEGDLAQGSKLSPRALAAACTPSTRALILNTPNNPTGAVYSRLELEALLAKLPAAAWLISDELYRTLLYGSAHVSPIACLSDAAVRSVWIDGIAKSHGMTGLRIGYAAAPPPIVERMRRLASHETSCASSVSQHAALALLERFPGGDPELQALLQQNQRRVLEWARELDRRLQLSAPLLPVPPEGAFYAWLDLRAVPGEQSSRKLCERLLDRHGVALMFGEAFGSPGFARLAFALDPMTLERGLASLADGLALAVRA